MIVKIIFLYVKYSFSGKLMCGYSIFLGKSLSYDKFKQLYLNSNIVDRGGSGDNFDNPKQGRLYRTFTLFTLLQRYQFTSQLSHKMDFLFNGEIYNYTDLAKTNGWLDVDSDTILLSKLIDKYGINKAVFCMVHFNYLL